MLEKVLVCLDGSTPAERILPYITGETAAQHGKMILLTVIDLPETVLPINIPGSPAVTVSTPGAVKRTFTEENTANDYLKGQEKSLEAQGAGCGLRSYLRVTGRNDCQLCAGK